MGLSFLNNQYSMSLKIFGQVTQTQAKKIKVLKQEILYNVVRTVEDSREFVGNIHEIMDFSRLIDKVSILDKKNKARGKVKYLKKDLKCILMLAPMVLTLLMFVYFLHNFDNNFNSVYSKVLDFSQIMKTYTDEIPDYDYSLFFFKDLFHEEEKPDKLT
jgi:hypothetical protein